MQQKEGCPSAVPQWDSDALHGEGLQEGVTDKSAARQGWSRHKEPHPTQHLQDRDWCVNKNSAHLPKQPGLLLQGRRQTAVSWVSLPAVPVTECCIYSFQIFCKVMKKKKTERVVGAEGERSYAVLPCTEHQGVILLHKVEHTSNMSCWGFRFTSYF